MFCSVVCFVVLSWRRGHPRSCYTTFCYFFYGSRWLLPQKQAANNKVWTAGCGVRPPRATGRTIPPTPPTLLPRVFLDVCGWACVRSALWVRSKVLSEALSRVLMLFFPLQTSILHHTGWGCVNYKRGVQVQVEWSKKQISGSKKQKSLKLRRTAFRKVTL